MFFGECVKKNKEEPIHIICKRIEINKEYTGSFVDSCHFDECSNRNERVIILTEKNVWNKGRGWFFSVEGLTIDTY